MPTSPWAWLASSGIFVKKWTCCALPEFRDEIRTLMAITFLCERCGHPIEVDDRLGGKPGTCKHWGRPLVVPDQGGGAAPLRLRPVDGGEPVGVSDHLLDRPAPLHVRPAGEEPKPTPEAITSPDEPPPSWRRGRLGD